MIIDVDGESIHLDKPELSKLLGDESRSCIMGGERLASLSIYSFFFVIYILLNNFTHILLSCVYLEYIVTVMKPIYKKRNRNHKRVLKATIFDKRGMILSIGENSYTKSHPYMQKLGIMHGSPNSIYLHAEVAAILKCKDLTKAHRIMITKVDKDGGIVIVNPCKICQSAIKAAGIKIVERTNTNI